MNIAGGWEPGCLQDTVVNGKVLIVDDENANLVILSRMMGRLGYTAVTAEDGEAGLAAVARERPDIVLLDVNMPKLDGFEVVPPAAQERRSNLPYIRSRPGDWPHR